jgi:hypothetical protein
MYAEVNFPRVQKHERWYMKENSALPRKRSGVSAKRAHRIQETLCAAVRDVMSATVSFKMTHEASIERARARVWDTPLYKNAPRYVQGYVQGVYHILRDAMYLHHLEWRLSIDGVLLSPSEVRERLKTDINIYQRVDSEKSRHTYIGHPDKPY